MNTKKETKQSALFWNIGKRDNLINFKGTKVSTIEVFILWSDVLILFIQSICFTNVSCECRMNCFATFS